MLHSFSPLRTLMLFYTSSRSLCGYKDPPTCRERYLLTLSGVERGAMCGGFDSALVQLRTREQRRSLAGPMLLDRRHARHHSNTQSCMPSNNFPLRTVPDRLANLAGYSGLRCPWGASQSPATSPFYRHWISQRAFTQPCDSRDCGLSIVLLTTRGWTSSK